MVIDSSVEIAIAVQFPQVADGPQGERGGGESLGGSHPKPDGQGMLILQAEHYQCVKRIALRRRTKWATNELFRWTLRPSWYDVQADSGSMLKLSSTPLLRVRV